MKTLFTLADHLHPIDLNHPTADLSLAVDGTARAWYIDGPRFTPVVLGDWVGSVAQGGSVNFFDVHFNPHAHGTHTETAGHITRERHSINEHFHEPITWAALLRIAPKDGKVTFEDFKLAWDALPEEAMDDLKSVIISSETFSTLARGTSEPPARFVQSEGGHASAAPSKEQLPSNDGRPNEVQSPKNRLYSSTDWPYLEPEIGEWLYKAGIVHLLVDQPSVDREEDGGALACHRAFWGPEPERQLHRTISELLFVPEELPTGIYLLHLQVAPIENDAAPSRPLVFGPVLS